MNKTAIEVRNIFDAIPKNLEEEAFESLVQNKNVQIERIISKGHTSPESGWYDQERNEWILVLKGEAVISFENERKITLTVGSHVEIPAHKKHKVCWTDPQTETIWLAVHY